MKFIAYRYDPKVHSFTNTFSILANRASPNKMSGGKPPLRRIKTNLETLTNRVPMVVSGRDEHAIKAWNLGRDAIQQVDAYISWSLRNTLDRIGVLEDRGSFIDRYLQNGPVCNSKPQEPPRRGPKHLRSAAFQQAYRASLAAWKKNDQNGLRLLSLLRSHMHEVRFSAECCTAMVALRSKLLRKLGVEGRQPAAQRVLENVAGVCTWIAGKFAYLESLVEEAEKCKTPAWNVFFHNTALTQWRRDTTYRELVDSIKSRTLSTMSSAAQKDYRVMISTWNSFL